MSGINTGKVIVGGLLAGLVYNVMDFVIMGMVMAQEMQANAVRLNLDPAAMESTAGMATWVVIDFLFGILVVWIYALIRPRLGPGPKTAAVAAVVIYLAVTFVMFGQTQGGMMTWSLFAKMSVLQLVNSVVGAIAGAWAYTEG